MKFIENLNLVADRLRDAGYLIKNVSVRPEHSWAFLAIQRQKAEYGWIKASSSTIFIYDESIEIDSVFGVEIGKDDNSESLRIAYDLGLDDELKVVIVK